MIDNKFKSGLLCLLLTAGCSLQVIASEAIPVSTKPFSSVAIYPELGAPANVISTSNTRISAEVSARITSLAANVGEEVKKDQVLVRLDQTDYQLAVEREQAKLDAILARIDLADYELKRAVSLSKKQAVSEQLLKQRETELNTLLADEKGQRVALQQSKRNLGKTVIRAPFQAVITEHLGQVGELAAPGTPLLQIIDSSSLEVSSRIQARHAKEIEKSTSLVLLSEGTRYPLQLRVITPAIDNKTRTREARLLFKDKRAMPGSAGELLWKQSLASLPSDLVVKRNAKLGVFIVNKANNKQAQFVPLPGAEEGRPVATNLPRDTQIITRGRFRLQDGGSISVQTESQ
jgi:RND family efflux transporter MFP subunit